MLKNSLKNFALITLCTAFAVTAVAKTPVKQTTTKQSAPAKRDYYETHTRFSDSSSPWDFSAMLGLYNPGVGFGGLVAYRLVDELISGNNSLSVESGLNYVSVSDTLVGSSISYSVIEIPIQARWDFKVLDGKLIAGPRAGFDFLTASSVSINGVSYSISRSGGLYFQLGGFAIYRFTEHLGVRANLSIGSYTTLGIGLNYAL
jgi:hypothetical protein